MPPVPPKPKERTHAANIVFELSVQFSQKSMSHERFDLTVQEFFLEKNGQLIVASDDANLFKTIRGTLNKSLNIQRGLLKYLDCEALYKDLALISTEEKPVVIFLERILSGLPTIDFLSKIKTRYNNAKVVVTTNETTRENIALLYEKGADSVITKPISAGCIIEKIATTLKAQTTISELAEEAKKCLEQKNNAKVLELSDEILKIKPNSSIGFMLKGDALLAENQHEEAAKAYEEAYSAARLFLDPLKKLVDLYKGVDADLYFKYLQKLDTISPLNVERKMEIGKVCVQRKELEKADQYFQEAVEIAKNQAMQLIENILFSIAESFSEQSPALSEKYYGRILDLKKTSLSKDDMLTFNRLGIVMRKQGKLQEAIENYKRALEICKTDPAIHYNMGLAYFDLKQYGAALECYENAMRIDTTFCETAPVVASNIGYCYILNQKYPEAIAVLTIGEKMAPHDTFIKSLLKEARTKARK
jgi:tetratricopeptide (TPR) repeat protein